MSPATTSKKGALQVPPSRRGPSVADDAHLRSRRGHRPARAVGRARRHRPLGHQPHRAGARAPPHRRCPRRSGLRPGVRVPDAAVGGGDSEPVRRMGTHRRARPPVPPVAALHRLRPARPRRSQAVRARRPRVPARQGPLLPRQVPGPPPVRRARPASSSPAPPVTSTTSRGRSTSTAADRARTAARSSSSRRPARPTGRPTCGSCARRAAPIASSRTRSGRRRATTCPAAEAAIRTSSGSTTRARSPRGRCCSARRTPGSPSTGRPSPSPPSPARSSRRSPSTGTTSTDIDDRDEFDFIIKRLVKGTGEKALRWLLRYDADDVWTAIVDRRRGRRGRHRNRRSPRPEWEAFTAAVPPKSDDFEVRALRRSRPASRRPSTIRSRSTGSARCRRCAGSPGSTVPTPPTRRASLRCGGSRRLAAGCRGPRRGDPHPAS